MVVLGGRRPNALNQRLSRERRERRAGIRVEYISGSQGEFDLVATRGCEIACFLSPLNPTDEVVLRERMDADEYLLVRSGGKLIVHNSSGVRVDRSDGDVSALLIKDVTSREDALLSSLEDGEAWIAQWTRLRRSTEYGGLRSPLILLDVEDPIFGILPVAMSEQRAGATGIPFLPVKQRGNPISIRAALDVIGAGDFGGVPYGGLWQIERESVGRPSVCLHRAVAIFKRYAGLPKSL